MIAQPAPRIVALVAVTLAIAGCGSGPVRPTAGVPVTGEVPETPGDRAAAVALDQLGVRYRYGGNTPRGFDCSGLVQYAYRQAGLSVPRTTGQLLAAAEPVGIRQLRPGDLLFFSIEGKVSHVGMYVNEQRFVHAPQSGRTVSVASLNSPFYRTALVRAGRIY